MLVLNVDNFYAGHPQRKTLFTNYYGSSVIADYDWPYYCRLLFPHNMICLFFFFFANTESIQRTKKMLLQCIKSCKTIKINEATTNNWKVIKVSFSSTVVLSLVVSQQSVWLLECSQPCLHQLHVLSTAFSWWPHVSFSLWIVLLHHPSCLIFSLKISVTGAWFHWPGSW